jgi:hypothetical protein
MASSMDNLACFLFIVHFLLLYLTRPFLYLLSAGGWSGMYVLHTDVQMQRLFYAFCLCP